MGGSCESPPGERPFAASDISVVIPTLNEQATIGDAIASVAGAGEVIVIDGGSDDATCEVAASAGATVVRTALPSRGLQLATGADRCRGAILLFLHADNRLGGGVLPQIADSLSRHPERGWGAMRQRIEPQTAVYRVVQWGNAWRIRYRGIPFGDQAMFVRRDWYETAGGFENVPLMEDLRLATRLRKRAWPILIDGPVWVNDRRWRRRGVVRQTMLNLSLQLAHGCGVSPGRLAKLYR
jgi:rSAM/selenodomain-associated transferase 2